jgi:hypothetical protein
MDERVFIYLSTSDQILKEIPLRSSDEAIFIERWIKSGVEEYFMGSFDIKRIMCPTNTRFMPIEEEGFDYFRKIMKQPTA